MISLVIPTYEMHGRGVEMLSELIESIHAQTYKDVEIIVVDSSDDNQVADWCVTNSIPCLHRDASVGEKFNYGFGQASGDIIKPMCQDDKFMETDSLQKIADALKHTEWAACTSHNAGDVEAYDHVPYAHASLKALREGENTYGSPSAMAWRRNGLRFDVNLMWLLDCEFYARMAEKYGIPQFVDTKIYIRQWEGQLTRTNATGHQRLVDTSYVVNKYA